MPPFFGTASEPVILNAAGTGGLEAAIVNTLSPGDRVLAVSIGAFGDRFAKIGSVYGADVTKIEVECGRAADPHDIPAVPGQRAGAIPRGPAHPQRDEHRRHRLDMAPAGLMLITRHQDRAGTVGRIGLMLGAAT